MSRDFQIHELNTHKYSKIKTLNKYEQIITQIARRKIDKRRAENVFNAWKTWHQSRRRRTRVLGKPNVLDGCILHKLWHQKSA